MNETITIPEDRIALCMKAAENPDINAIEKVMCRLPQVDNPLTHRFCHDEDGRVNLYAREIFNPKGTLITTKIHKTEHPFVLLSGTMRIWIPGQGAVRITAPHVGITKPGTRRVIYAETDVRFMTFHAVDTDDLDEIERQLIYPHDFGLKKIEAEQPAELCIS